MVLSYPHFLYADHTYKNGVIGMTPVEEQHRIFADLDPYTGTVIRGSKRAQFNVFMRPVRSIAATNALRTTLTPIFWVDEGMSLPEDLTNMIKRRLLGSLNLVDIFIPILISLSAFLAVFGVVLVLWTKRRSNINI
ncbi:unnamed protein product [Pieris macdunnoughi]|uniref:Sensory neuron membrane protein 2 n=1 Tax=Pieris macdunnoughi TaxID=345717 RepID=A0A821L7U2_9NEOP|nr:unnamed protein product [Pieris macdunnoughi]